MQVQTLGLHQTVELTCTWALWSLCGEGWMVHLHALLVQEMQPVNPQANWRRHLEFQAWRVADSRVESLHLPRLQIQVSHDEHLVVVHMVPA